jgi:hypothetical protein
MNNTETTKEVTSATVREPGAEVASNRKRTRKRAIPRQTPPKAAKSAKAGKAKKTGKPAAKPARAGDRAAGEMKSARIVDMIGRAKGATLAELMKATGWQAHSVRGFISNARRKNGLRVNSVRSEPGERTYQIGK